MKYSIERTESIFVDSAMIVLDLNDRKNGSIEAVILKYNRLSRRTFGRLRRTSQFN